MFRLAATAGACGLLALLVGDLPRPTTAAGLPLPPDLVSLDSSLGAERLLRGTTTTETVNGSCTTTNSLFQMFATLATELTTQNNGAFCGVASSVTALNALGVRRPLFDGWEPPGDEYFLFTQSNFFDQEETAKVKTSDSVRAGGMTLAELEALLATFDGVKVRRHHAADVSSASELQELLSSHFRSGGVALVNYDRKTLGTEGGGHISPVGAFDESSDSYLLLDVARYKYAPHWTPAALLFDAINTVDPVSGLTRGVVLLSTRPGFESGNQGEAGGTLTLAGIFSLVIVSTFLLGCCCGGVCFVFVFPRLRKMWERRRSRGGNFHTPIEYGSDESSQHSGVSLAEEDSD